MLTSHEFRNMDYRFTRDSHIVVVISLLVFGIVFALAVIFQLMDTEMLKCQITDFILIK